MERWRSSRKGIWAIVVAGLTAAVFGLLWARGGPLYATVSLLGIGTGTAASGVLGFRRPAAVIMIAFAVTGAAAAYAYVVPKLPLADEARHFVQWATTAAAVGLTVRLTSWAVRPYRKSRQ